MGGAGGAPTGGTGGSTSVGEFKLTSPDHEDAAKFAPQYTCELKGFNGSIMPELNWTAGPQGTKSYAITFLDVSLTTGAVQGQKQLGYHWAIWNIPSSVTSLPEGLKSGGIAAIGPSTKQTGDFLGPCPGGDTHNYEFTIYALSTETINITGTGIQGTQDAETKLEAANALAKDKLAGTSNASQ